MFFSSSFMMKKMEQCILRDNNTDGDIIRLP